MKYKSNIKTIKDKFQLVKNNEITWLEFPLGRQENMPVNIIHVENFGISIRVARIYTLMEPPRFPHVILEPPIESIYLKPIHNNLLS